MPSEISREDWLREPSREELERHAQYGDPTATYALALLDELEAARAVIVDADQLFIPNDWHSGVRPRCADCKGALIGRRNGDLSCSACDRWSDPRDEEEAKHIEYYHPAKDVLRAYLAKYGKPAVAGKAEG